MTTTGIRELRRRASELLRRVETGETIEITDRGRPVAVLAPLPDRTQPAASELTQSTWRLPRNSGQTSAHSSPMTTGWPARPRVAGRASSPRHSPAGTANHKEPYRPGFRPAEGFVERPTRQLAGAGSRGLIDWPRCPAGSSFQATESGPRNLLVISGAAAADRPSDVRRDRLDGAVDIRFRVVDVR